MELITALIMGVIFGIPIGILIDKYMALREKSRNRHIPTPTMAQTTYQAETRLPDIDPTVLLVRAVNSTAELPKDIRAELGLYDGCTEYTLNELIEGVKRHEG